MFLIIGTWPDGSSTIFIASHDPLNRKLPHSVEVFDQLDSVGDPHCAILQYSRVGRHFILNSDAKGYELEDCGTVKGSVLKPLKFPDEIFQHWLDEVKRNTEDATDTDLDE